MRYALLMKRWLICILVVFTGSVMAETVYKTVDEDGNIIFTDKPSEEAEKIELQELQTIKNPNPAKYRPPTKADDSDDEPIYQAFSVVKPANDEGYRNNAGNVTIQLSLQPSLQRGHQVVIKMDGKEISNGKSLSVSLQNVDRGAHSISASVVDRGGQTIISTSSSFAMLRAAVGGP